MPEKKYIILRANWDESDELEDLVNQYIDLGYMPIGSVFYNVEAHGLGQPMMKKLEEENDE